MYVGEALFRNSSLSDYLRGQVSAIDNHVRNSLNKSDLSKTDAEIVDQMLAQARVAPLAVDFDHPEKDVREARIQVGDVFGGRGMVDGVIATRRYRFTGQAELFGMRPSSWSTMLPYGRVEFDHVVIGWSGRGDDAEAIKTELDSQEKTLREYVGNSVRQIEEHNQQLQGLLAQAVANRRQQLQGLDDLKGKL